MTQHDGEALPSVSPQVARDVRASAVGLHSSVVAVASTLEALCDSALAADQRERRSAELYRQLGDVRLALSQLAEAVLPPPGSSSLDVVQSDLPIQVPTSRWRQIRRPPHR